jgi:phage gpG-like protein
MISININPSEINKAFADLSKYSAKVQAGVKKESVRAAYSIDSKAKNTCPVKYGHLRQSIHVETQIGALMVVIPENGAVVGTNKQYAASMEFGSKPHIIRPINKKMLRWWNGNMFIFAKEVHHPGTKGFFFLTRAAESERPIFIQNILSILKRSTK